MLLTAEILLLAVNVFLGFKKPKLALITAVVTSIVAGFVGYLTQSTVAVVIAPIIFLATLITVLIAKYKYSPVEWSKQWASYLIKSLPFVVLLFLLIINKLPFAVGFFALFISAVISYTLISLDTTAAYIMSTIGSSIRQNLPLPMALESAAIGQSDKNSRILRRIQKWLVQGYSLSESIKRGYPRCPGYAIAMIAAAERIGQLPLAIQSIEADMLAKADSRRRKVEPVNPIFSMIIIFFIIVIILGLVKFVLPKYQRLLFEMGLFGNIKLPASTRFLMWLHTFLTYKIGWSVLLALFLIAAVFALFLIWVGFRPRRPQKPYITSRIGDFIKWHSPMLRWFENNYSMLQVVEVLRLSLNAGCTVNQAIIHTLDLDVNHSFKKRLRKWLVKVEAGDNIADAARKSSLGNGLAWAFDEKINQGDALAILEILESVYRSNYSYRINLLRFILWTCVTIVTGAIVGFVVYAIFSPLVLLVNYLAGSYLP